MGNDRVEGLLEVRDCPHGRGVFASRDFLPGDLIRSFPKMVVTTAPRSPPWKRWAIIVGRTPDGQPLFWDEEGEESADYWSNFLDHSAEPNVRFSIDIAKGRADLYAAGSIKAGEELFIDYKKYDPGNWAPRA